MAAHDPSFTHFRGGGGNGLAGIGLNINALIRTAFPSFLSPCFS